MSFLVIIRRERRKRPLRAAAAASALVALARWNAGGGANFLELLLDSGKITEALPAADGCALLVEGVWPHGGSGS